MRSIPWGWILHMQLTCNDPINDKGMDGFVCPGGISVSDPEHPQAQQAQHIPPDMGACTAEYDHKCGSHCDICQNHQGESRCKEVLLKCVSHRLNMLCSSEYNVLC